MSRWEECFTGNVLHVTITVYTVWQQITFQILSFYCPLPQRVAEGGVLALPSACLSVRTIGITYTTAPSPTQRAHNRLWRGTPRATRKHFLFFISTSRVYRRAIPFVILRDCQNWFANLLSYFSMTPPADFYFWFPFCPLGTNVDDLSPWFNQIHPGLDQPRYFPLRKLLGKPSMDSSACPMIISTCISIGQKKRSSKYA